MKQYIDKSEVVKEIEKRINENNRKAASYSSGSEHDYLYRIEEEVYKDLLSFLNTLKVKEVDLEKYYHDFLQKEWFDGNHARTISEMMFFTAKHFFELGLKAKGEFMDTINFSWKPITEIPTEHWERNDAISPLYLVRCGEKNGVSILGYSHYSFATKQWMDCYSTTDTDYDVMHKVTEWTDVKI